MLMMSAARMLLRKFLVDPLEQPLRAGAFDLHGNAGIGASKALPSFSPTGRSIEE